jgi:hypothetical protein
MLREDTINGAGLPFETFDDTNAQYCMSALTSAR